VFRRGAVGRAAIGFWTLLVHGVIVLLPGGYRTILHIKPEFAVADLAVARALVREYPFGTLVGDDLRTTHMPFLVEEKPNELILLGHVARADPVADVLSAPVLAIFAGPRGYVSASWYESETIPTWNHVTLHVRGVPELFDDALPVLERTVVERTVDHFEAALARPWSLARLGDTARRMAGEVIAFRLRAESWHAEAKLSQDKPARERARVLAGLEQDSTYANPALAAAMRNLGR
jgi:transcriptional regulator